MRSIRLGMFVAGACAIASTSAWGAELKDGSIRYVRVPRFVAVMKRTTRAKDGRWVKRFRIRRGRRVEGFQRTARKHWGEYYYKVRFNGREGWVPKRKIKTLGELPSAATKDGALYYAKIAPRKATVKRSAKVKSGRWMTRFRLRKGREVDVDAKSIFRWWGDFYYRVSSGGKSGWVSEKYLSLHAPAKVAAVPVAGPVAKVAAAPVSEPAARSASEDGTPGMGEAGSAGKSRTAEPAGTEGGQEVADKSPSGPVARFDRRPANPVSETALHRAAVEAYYRLHPVNWDAKSLLVGTIGLAMWQRLDPLKPGSPSLLQRVKSPLSELGIENLAGALGVLFKKTARVRRVMALTPLQVVALFERLGLIRYERDPKKVSERLVGSRKLGRQRKNVGRARRAARRIRKSRRSKARPVVRGAQGTYREAARGARRK